MADERAVKHWIPGIAVVLALVGCRTPSRLVDIGPRYEPINVHTEPLPAHLRRAVLLPLAESPAAGAMDGGAEHLFPVLQMELQKLRAFEVIVVTPEQLEQWTGRRAWRADEALPADLLIRLREETAGDGVVFATLTAYRAYPPLAVGLNLRLVDLKTGGVVWAVDEVLDAGAQPVVRAARDYSAAQIDLPRVADDGSAVLHSPRRFGQFAAATLVGTLPSRAEFP